LVDHFLKLLLLPIAGQHTRTDRTAIAAGSDQLHLNPAGIASKVVGQQGGRLVEIDNQDVEIAVIIEIAKGTAAAGVQRLQIRVVREMALNNQVTVEVAVANSNTHAGLLDSIVVQPAAALHSLFAKRAVVIVHQEQAGAVPVVVVVPDADAGGPAGAQQGGRFRDVGECAVAVLLIEAVKGSRGGLSKQVPQRTKISIRPLPD